MSLPNNGGVPSWSGSYIPSLFSEKVLAFFYLMTVMTQICNVQYEAEIKQFGESLVIPALPDVLVQDMTVDGDINHQFLTPKSTTLNIDRMKGWAFAIPIAQQAQSKVKNWDSRVAEHAAQQMKIAFDADLLSDVYSDVDAANTGATAGKESGGYDMGVTGTPRSLTKDTVTQFITDCGNVLDEQSIPRDGKRFIVLPNWVGGVIKNSDLKNASITGDGKSMLRNGLIGEIDEFKVLLSNNIKPVVDGAGKGYNIVYGHQDAITMATQVMYSSEPFRLPGKFAMASDGFQVMGWNVNQPTALGHGYIAKG